LAFAVVNLYHSKLLIASKNRDKVSEFRQLFSGKAVEILSIDDFPIPEVEETGKSFLENANIKAEAAIELIDAGVAVVADDSGLCIDALSGAPGVRSARFANGDFISAMDRILEKMKEVEWHGRGAHFECALCLILSSGERHNFEGRLGGTIAMERHGNGFGYDPIFIPSGHSRTLGEMAAEEKNKLSHRGIALGKLLKFFSL
jgi:XTP/dITP diphosphohydrolase